MPRYMPAHYLPPEAAKRAGVPERVLYDDFHSGIAKHETIRGSYGETVSRYMNADQLEAYQRVVGERRQVAADRWMAERQAEHRAEAEHEAAVALERVRHVAARYGEK